MTDEPPDMVVAVVYVCQRCKARSYHPMDAAHRYCVHCHRFEDDPLPDDGETDEKDRP